MCQPNHPSLSQVNTKFKTQINSKLRMRQHALLVPPLSKSHYMSTVEPRHSLCQQLPEPTMLCFRPSRFLYTASLRRTSTSLHAAKCRFTAIVRAGWLKAPGSRPPNSITTVLAAAATTATLAAVWKPRYIRGKFRQQQQQQQHHQ